MGYQKLGVNTGHRKAMLRNLVTSLFRDEDQYNGKGQRSKKHCRKAGQHRQAGAICPAPGPGLYLRRRSGTQVI